jgi:hypothetical protein
MEEDPTGIPPTVSDPVIRVAAHTSTGQRNPSGIITQHRVSELPDLPLVLVETAAAVGIFGEAPAQLGSPGVMIPG